jgi:hypothetical protein
MFHWGNGYMRDILLDKIIKSDTNLTALKTLETIIIEIMEHI